MEVEMKLKFLVLVLILAGPALFAEIQVKASSGVKTEGARTNLVLKSGDGDMTQVYRILDSSVMMASGYSSSGDYLTMSGSGLGLQLICEAPAELVLDGGVYQFQLTDGIIFAGKFDVSATGGTQVWEVDKGWGKGATPFIMSGLMSIICGGLTLGLGASLESQPGWLTPFGAIFLGYGVVSFPLGMSNRPKAKRLE